MTTTEERGVKSGVISPGDINTSERLVSGYMSTIDVDDIGDVVLPGGMWETQHFKTYGSVNWDHDITKAVGSHRNFKIGPRGVRVTWYCSKGILGSDCWTMINEGVLKGMSLHWDRKTVKYRAATQDDRKSFGDGARRVIESWGIVTYAVTAVGMNPFTSIDEVKSRTDFANSVDRLVRLGRITVDSAKAFGWRGDDEPKFVTIPNVGVLKVDPQNPWRAA